MIITWGGSLVGLPMVLPLRYPIGMDFGNPLEPIIESPNTVSVLVYLFVSMACTILGNLPEYLLVSSVGILPGSFLVNWASSILGIFPIFMLGVPIGLVFGPNLVRYLFLCRFLMESQMARY